MIAEIICVGTELLLGQILNTNAQYLSQKLAEYGIDLYFQTVVGDNIERIKYVTKGVRINYKNFYLVGNYRFTDEVESHLLQSGERYLGKIQFDPKVRENNLRGDSLFEIPDDSPSCLSVKKILKGAGYESIF